MVAPPRISLRRVRAALAIAVASAAALGGAASAEAATDIKINFQPGTSTVPLGYVADTGLGYSTTAARGWVRENTLGLANEYHTGINLSSRARDRGGAQEPRLRTFVIAETTAPVVRGAFEVDVPPGTYDVEVGMGDSAAFDSVYYANIEGQPLIQGFVPSTTTPFTSATGRFTVSDGRLTLSQVGGTNGKFNYITIKDAPADVTPPAATTGLGATAGTGQVTLNWTANTEADLAGYRVYRSTSTPVPTGGTPVNGATLVTGTVYNDQAVVNGTQYHYAVVAVDRAGNAAPASNEAQGTPTAPPPGAFDLKVDFKTTTSPLPAGYVADTGLGFDSTRGFGFVTESSLSSPTHTPLDVTSRTRYRTPATDDVRLNTLVHLNGTTGAAAWEAEVPVGDYAVTVAAGDPAAFDSVHTINVEGTNAITFPATSEERITTATVTVRVEDGRLTIDGIGGTNSKLLYVDIAATTSGSDTEAPEAPMNVVGAGDLSGIHLSWSPNTEPDLAGYSVYRSISLPVPTDGTPLNGTTPLTITSFNDTTANATTPYYYAVVAIDTAGNRSGGSNPVQVTQPATPIDYKFNFQSEAAPTVLGYTRDYGLSFLESRGHGWVTQDSLSSTHVPVSLTAFGRDRNLIADQRLDTFMHMQFPGTGGVRAAWEAVVPNGSYDVAVSVGDPGATDSTHAINVEGQPTISEFLPTATSKFRASTVTVNVADGRLTIDAIGGVNTKLNYVTIKNADTGTRPSLGDVQPYDGATQVSRSRAITAEVNLPNLGAGVDTATLNSDSVRLLRVSDNSQVAVNRNTSAGGDVIVVQPRAQLAPNTEYRFEVNSLLKDVSGVSFIPKTTSFTTGTSTSTTNNIARFIKSPQAAGAGEMMTSLTMGPDQQLYSATLFGQVLRFPVDEVTGELSTPTTITSIIDSENGPRHILGLAFDPASTPTEPILWVTHGHPAFANAPDWTGKLTRLSGPDLSVAQDFVTGLPRSVRDHETNSVEFGPDGKLYITQGSNTATGRADLQWGERPERLLSAAVLRVDPDAITAPPLDAKTEEGGTYDPFAVGAPVTLYASGVRNAFDLVWHTNGEMYVPVNGSAANGNTPATPETFPDVCNNRLDFGIRGPFTGPAVPGLTGIGVQPDLLLRVQSGGYYGHPNPSRCEYSFFGGNPTSAVDPLETIQYPVGTQPDRNFRQPSWDFGAHFSPNGAIEYKSTKFGGALNGALLVARYSAGDDIVALPIDPVTKEVTEQEDGIPGLGGLTDPLDIAQDTRNGNLYVTELGAAQITLIKPDETGGAPKAALSPSREIANAVVGTTSADQEVTIRNSGNAPLRLNDIQISGADAAEFSLNHVPSMPQLIDPDQEVTVDVRFAPTSVGVKTASLDVTTDDPTQAVRTVALRGLGTAGEGGADEPSLQRILDTYEIAVNVGDDDPAESTLPQGPIVGQEVPIQSMRKAGPGKVTVEPIAVFANQGEGSAVGNFGWNETSNSEDLPTIGTIPNGSAQALHPRTTGPLSFDPDSATFGFWSSWAFFQYRTVFTQDSLNTVAGVPSHQARGYELRDSNGTVVPDAYIVAFEAVAPATQDFQDLVFIVRNVQPEGSGTGRVSLTNLDGAPFDDRLVFNRIGSLASPPSNGVHDRATVRVRNTGGTPLTVTELPITGPFELASAPELPFTLAPGTNQDVQVKFTAESGNVSTGSMTIVNDTALTPSVRVELAGFWQSVSEQGQEPELDELVEAFGYGTKITRPGQNVNAFGRVEAVGDEVISPYWRRADPRRTSRVTQLGAFHTQGNVASFRWYMRGGDVRSTTLVHSGADGQSFLPHKLGSTTEIATATFSPTAAFGFKIDGEYSDPTMNNAAADIAAGCVAPCGHHVRAWPAKTRTGQTIPDTYIVAMDYSGINYDYNDNTYLITNITPDIADQPLLFRVDAGSSTGYTDQAGRVWAPDTGLFSPPTAIDEGNPTAPIANTQDDPLFATYRGNVGSVPLSQRILDYRFPTGTATKVDIRLYFAERAWTSSGQRRFNILAEGVQKNPTPIDLFSVAGGRDVAWSTAYSGISVTDGALDLRFQTVADYPSIAGIEVFCAENCGSD